MRLTTLLVLVIALILLAAPAASFAQTTSPSKSGALFTGDSAAVIHLDGSSSLSPNSATSWKFDTMNSQSVCLTMRTYVVARDSRNSDVTHPVRYYECVPAWKFDVRTSQQKDLGAGAQK